MSRSLEVRAAWTVTAMSRIGIRYVGENASGAGLGLPGRRKNPVAMLQVRTSSIGTHRPQCGGGPRVPAGSQSDGADGEPRDDRDERERPQRGGIPSR